MNFPKKSKFILENYFKKVLFDVKVGAKCRIKFLSGSSTC